jgi:predicted metal-dependent RNase
MPISVVFVDTINHEILFTTEAIYNKRDIIIIISKTMKKVVSFSANPRKLMPRKKGKTTVYGIFPDVSCVKAE